MGAAQGSWKCHSSWAAEIRLPVQALVEVVPCVVAAHSFCMRRAADMHGNKESVRLGNLELSDAVGIRRRR
ncbi:hypothetical protein VTK56DRAFT_6010 [Thermocarpiscus australiensis]